MPPDLTSMTSSFSSENVTKFSSSTTTTSNIGDVSLPPLQQPLGISNFEQSQQQQQQQQQVQQMQYQQQQQQFKPVQKQVPVKQVPQTPPKPAYQNMPQQQPKPQTPVMKPMSPGAELKAPTTPVSRSENVSPRSGYSAGSVTPGILKKQIQLDAAVPVMPGCPSPINVGRMNGKSPVPFINTAPAPFGVCPGLSVQTPQSIAEVAPSTALVPPLQNPPPLPLIVNTPLPQYNSTYNNSARPFTQFKDFYRPVNMDSVNHKLVPPVIYTDF